MKKNSNTEFKLLTIAQFLKKKIVSNIQDTLDAIIPTKEEMLSTVRIMKLLTLRLTKSLGDYERKYLDAMDCHSRALVNV